MTAVGLVAAEVRAAERIHPCGDGEMGERALRHEVSAALRVSDQAAGCRVGVADQLGGRLKVVAAALVAGDISYWNTAAIVDATAGLTDD